jgi:hypothetical protein
MKLIAKIVFLPLTLIDSQEVKKQTAQQKAPDARRANLEE